MSRSIQTRVRSPKQPVALGRFEFLSVRESESLAVVIAKLFREALDVRFCNRLFGEELFPRTFDAVQTLRHAHHPGSAWCVVRFDDSQNCAPRHAAPPLWRRLKQRWKTTLRSIGSRMPTPL